MGRQGLVEPQVRCAQCGTAEVEICLPTHFKANSDLSTPTSVDVDAEALTYWCAFCRDDVAVQMPDGEVRRGRWDRAGA